MELFTFIPYFLLLEREESDRNTLANANTEFIREVYAVKRRESGVVRKERRRNSAALHSRRRQHRYRGGQRAAPNAGKILYRNNSFHSVQL